MSIQPVGGTTLVNLPTYYRITWDTTGLTPGTISQPVQLLTWAVDFKIAVASYTIDYGDATTSPPTTDPGGVYPTGSIRHTYKTPNPAAHVNLHTTLTGEYRANNGPWQPLNGTATLPDPPPTPLRIAEARSQLVTR